MPPHAPPQATTPRRIWLLLMVLTLLSVAIAEQIGATKIAIVAIFLISAIKADRVVVHYMEVKHAEPNWQPLYRMWTLAVAALLTVGHLARW
jgi:caa(3)-type oxidase subunit IV